MSCDMYSNKYSASLLNTNKKVHFAENFEMRFEVFLGNTITNRLLRYEEMEKI